MSPTRVTALMTRRRMLQATALAGGALAGRAAYDRFLGDVLFASQPAAPADALTAMRAQMGAAPIEPLALGDNLTMLSGPGGNVVVLNGPDGKIVVDTFVLPAWDRLKQALDGMGGASITLLINTHWHFDHTDNNANFRQAGATIVAHENTAKRLAESHDLLGMHFDPAPDAARPTQTFADRHVLAANGESLNLGAIPPAHTDTDIYIQFAKANVIHLGDTFFNGVYPVIDAGTGGSINGMIRAADLTLKSVDRTTRIVPGHGPLADRAALTRFRDMLVAVRDRVQTLKSGGRSLQETLAARPSAAFDATWGQGFMQPNDFLTIVYNTL